MHMLLFVILLCTHTFFSWLRGKHSRNTSSSGCGRPSSHTVRTAYGTCSAACQNWRFPSSTHTPRGKVDREHVNKHFYSHTGTHRFSWIACVQLNKWIPFPISYTWTHHSGLYIRERILLRMRGQFKRRHWMGLSRCSSPRHLCWRRICHHSTLYLNIKPSAS